jgi:hypothetical protein
MLITIVIPVFPKRRKLNKGVMFTNHDAVPFPHLANR